jgi:hypothetical protein
LRYDDLGTLIREFHAEGEPGNYGDSCAETARIKILGGFGNLNSFVKVGGFIRHKRVEDLWGMTDFSGDQFVPFFMAMKLIEPESSVINVVGNETKIPGTETRLTPAAWFLIRGHYRCLDWANRAQGVLLALPYRIADGGKIEKSDGQVQDYLNMICIAVFLKKMGKKATLPRPFIECYAAVIKYYETEPNSQWIVDLYHKALLDLAYPYGTSPTASVS